MTATTKLSKTAQDDPLLVPTEQEWAQMSSSERANRENIIISALEHEFNLMGETTIHFEARASATEVLKRYFGNQGKHVFIASDLHTLYPGENAFYPDLLVVFDVNDHHRRSWNVLTEKKGLDFALEILSRKTRRNDQVGKLNLFARLGIPEYFMFDPDQYTLKGYQLNHRVYEEIKPDASKRVFSNTLGLYLMVEDYKLRFALSKENEILFGDELIDRLNSKLSKKDIIIADSARLLEEERKQKAEVEQQKDAEQQQKNAERKQKEEAQKQQEEQKIRADRLEKEVEQLRLLLKQKKH